MDTKSRFMAWLKEIPNWAKSVSVFVGAILTLVTLFLAIKDNFQVLAVLFVIPLLILTVILFSSYLIRAKTEPLVAGGSGVFIFGIVIRVLAGIFMFLAVALGISYYTSQRGRADVIKAWYGTSTPIPSSTPTSVPSVSPVPTLTPRPLADYLHYMVVLDASFLMQKEFEGAKAWDVALKTFDEIMLKLNENAHFGLVVVGGSASDPKSEPCDLPDQPSIPMFGMNRDNLRIYARGIAPQGGGSFDVAFNTAKSALEKLAPGEIKMLIFITGLDDTCEGVDEWSELQNSIDLLKGVDLYSQIVILDEDGVRSQKLADRINAISKNVDAQAPQTLDDINGGVTIVNVFNNVTNYIQSAGASIPTAPPHIVDTTFTLTPRPGATTVTPFITIPPSYTFTSAPTWTPSSTSTPAYSFSPTIIGLSSDPATSCNSQALCRIDVTIQWVPDSQTQGKYLTVWVRPLPDEVADGGGQDYWSQTPSVYQGNGVWKVTDCSIGQIDDYNGMDFAIYAIVTDVPYGTQIPLTYLPPHSEEYRTDVMRGTPP